MIFNYAEVWGTSAKHLPLLPAPTQAPRRVRFPDRRPDEPTTKQKQAKQLQRVQNYNAEIARNGGRGPRRAKRSMSVTIYL